MAWNGTDYGSYYDAQVSDVAGNPLGPRQTFHILDADVREDGDVDSIGSIFVNTSGSNHPRWMDDLAITADEDASWGVTITFEGDGGLYEFLYKDDLGTQWKHAGYLNHSHGEGTWVDIGRGSLGEDDYRAHPSEVDQRFYHIKY